MKMNKSYLAIALVATLGVSASVMESATAASLLSDGDYQIIISNTPYATGTYGPFAVFGSDGAWNSGFTTGCPAGQAGCSMAMSDNSVVVNGKGGAPTDGVAGRINITVTGGVITGGNLFQVDAILATCCGDLAQYTADGTASGMTGTIDAAGNMTFTPNNRLGAFSFSAAFVDKRLNVDDYTIPTSTVWNTFTTGASTNNAGTVHGTPCTALGGGNFQCVLVSGTQLGNEWGSLAGIPMSERWKVTLTAVPVPAAAWLFGSGLLGLLGVSRRKRAG